MLILGLQQVAFSQWNSVSGGLRQGANIEVGGTSKFEKEIILSNRYVATTFKHTFTVRISQTACSTIVVRNNSPTYNFPPEGSQTICSVNASTVPEIVYATIAANISLDQTQGIKLSQNPTSPVFITPQGGIKATNLVGVGSRMLITDANGNIASQALSVPSFSPWVADGVHYP